MYSRISIKNFRGIGSLEVDGLRRINLIVGRNNSGKTTFLEGLFLLGGATIRVCNRTRSVRGQRYEEGRPDQVWRSLFHNMDPKESPEISGHWAQELRERVLTVQALDVSSYTGSFELPNWGGSGVAAVTPEFLFGGVQFRTTDSEGNVTAVQATLDPNSGTVLLGGEEDPTWCGRPFSALEIIPTRFVMLRHSALSVRSKANLISSRLSRSSSQECNESKFFLRLPVHRSTST